MEETHCACVRRTVIVFSQTPVRYQPHTSASTGYRSRAKEFPKVISDKHPVAVAHATRPNSKGTCPVSVYQASETVRIRSAQCCPGHIMLACATVVLS
jgi:hypothetical protein